MNAPGNRPTDDGTSDDSQRQGLPDIEELADQVKEMIEKLGKEKGANVAATVNLGGGGSASVSSHQRIVQRNGKTETVTERIEHKVSKGERSSTGEEGTHA